MYIPEYQDKNIISNHKYLSETIMGHFSPEFLESIIDNNFKIRDKMILLFKTNVIDTLEINYNQIPNNNLLEDKIFLYKNIIKKIFDYNQISINENLLDDINENLYKFTNIMYQILILNYRENMIEFMSQFILNESKSLFNIAELSNYKRNKDVTTTSFKKKYNDKKLPYIIANLENVINCIGVNYSISIFDILNYLQVNKDIINNLKYIIIDENNFFINNYINSFINSEYKEDVLIDLKLNINNKLNLLNNN